MDNKNISAVNKNTHRDRVISRLLQHIENDSLDVPVSINGFEAVATLDTGAEVSVIGQNLLHQLPNYEQFKSVPNYHKGLLLASREKVSVIDCVKIPITLGGKTIPIEFHVLRSSNFLLGLPALRQFRTRLTFEEDIIHIEINSIKIPLHDSDQFDLLLENEQRVTLKPQEIKMVTFQVSTPISQNLEGMEIQTTAHNGGSSLIVPSLCQIKNGKCLLPVRNTSRKKVILRPKRCLGVGKEFKGELHVTTPVTVTDLIRKLVTDETLGFQYHSSGEMNMGFYQGKNPTVRKIKVDSTGTLAADTLFELEELPLGAPDRPAIDLEEVLEKELDSTLSPKHREQLKNVFRQHPKVCAQYFFDAGDFRDHTGEIVKINIPLRKEIDRNTKTYKLSPMQQTILGEIMDHLIYNRLAVEVTDPEKNFGCPVFLVERAQPGGQGRPARVILDQRSNNQCLLNPLGTPGESVADAVTQIAQSAVFLSSIDLRKITQILLS